MTEIGSSLLIIKIEQNGDLYMIRWNLMPRANVEFTFSDMIYAFDYWVLDDRKYNILKIK